MDTDDRDTPYASPPEIDRDLASDEAIDPSHWDPFVATHIHWTRGDTTLAGRWHARQAISGSPFLFAGGITIVFALMASFRYLIRPAGAMPNIFLPVLIVLASRLWIRFAGRRLAAVPDPGQGTTWWIGTVGVQIRTQSMQANYPWKAFAKAVRTPDGLLLYPAETRTYLWLPRRAIANPLDFEALIVCAQQKVPKFADLDRI